MRIIELVDSLAVGGTERMVAHLGCGLKGRGHEVMVVCLREMGLLAQPLEEAGVKLAALRKGEGFQWRVLRGLRDLLRDFGAEVVHTHNPLVHHYGALGGRWAGVRAVVSTVHGIGNIQGMGKSEWIFGASCLMTDRVVAVCRRAQEVFTGHPLVRSSKLAVIYNGIPLEPYLKVRPKQNDGEFVFGVVGRMVPVKDHGLVLKAFAALAAEESRCRLEFVGDGELRGELERSAVALGIAGRVKFHGEQADVSGFYEGMDVFVLSSKSEGLPMTVLEAMASARPVVSTAVGGVPEVVEGARCGWLCEAGDEAGLAGAMREALRNGERGAMGGRAREYARAHGSVEAMVSGYENLFEELAGSRSR